MTWDTLIDRDIVALREVVNDRELVLIGTGVVLHGGHKDLVIVAGRPGLQVEAGRVPTRSGVLGGWRRAIGGQGPVDRGGIRVVDDGGVKVGGIGIRAS